MVVSIPSSRVGTKVVSPATLKALSFHPLKSGRNTRCVGVAGARYEGFHPLKSGRNLMSFDFPPERQRSFHPLKSGRNSPALRAAGTREMVSIPSSRVGTLSDSQLQQALDEFPSPQVGSELSSPSCKIAKMRVSIPSSRVGTAVFEGFAASDSLFPSPQVGSELPFRNK